MKEEIKRYPLTFTNFITKEKKQEKWLGDQFTEDGLSASVTATIKQRSGRAKAAIFEVKGIVEDYRMHVAGGLTGAFEIWEMVIVQALLNNSETWLDISNEDEITILSNCCYLRPLVFNYRGNYFDVYHA